MSTEEPTPQAEPHSDAIELVLQGRPRDLGAFQVRRVLPSPQRRLVGPFIFFDHMGPVQMEAGTGMDVRPHPHIGLATVTYLFEGEIVHRDSLGFHQVIRPADVNWMVAGRGIVHSERTAPERRQAPHPLHGIQAWVALPLEREEEAPSFHHHPAASLPALTRAGVELRVIAGAAFGLRSPVEVASPTLYAALQLSASTSFQLSDEHVERAFYVASGSVRCTGERFDTGNLVVLRPGTSVALQAIETAHIMLLGGEPLAGRREIFWNFVSSSTERIEQAKQAWKNGDFPKVPGDEHEFTPLPE